MHKTGTTAFQTFCVTNAERLKTMGFLYPIAGRPSQKDVALGHHLLPWFFTGHVSLPSYWPNGSVQARAVWEELRREIHESTCGTVILSSEEFDTLNDNQVSEVVEILSEFDIEIILYLRRLDDFVQAMYTTDVVYYGERERIESFLERMRTPLDYDALVRPWSNRGVAATIEYYTPEIGEHGSITADLCRTIGIDHSQFPKWVTTQKVNVGAWPWHVVEACRQLNERGFPSDVVGKLSQIMRICVGTSREYDLMQPSQRAALQLAGASSLASLAAEGLIPAIPPYFEQMIGGVDDETWARRYEDNDDPLRTVMTEILSTLTVRSRALEEIAKAIGKTIEK
jgi:hypothetical protein